MLRCSNSSSAPANRIGAYDLTNQARAAAGQKTAALVVDAWMNSPGHRANTLNGASTNIGIGAVASNHRRHLPDHGPRRMTPPA